jgi:hypothetical protein
LNQTYSFPQITADLIAAIESHPPVCRSGFHSINPADAPIESNTFADYQIYQFELARIWLRNFSPVRGLDDKRRFQWGAYQYSGSSIPGGLFLLAAHSLGFKPIHYPTALSRQCNVQILLLDVDSATVREFFRNNDHLVATEYDVLDATPAVQAMLAKQEIENAAIIAQL